ncbi:MAG: hypothetical protein ACJZ8H_01775 [Paracoccaceae bacterium]
MNYLNNILVMGILKKIIYLGLIFLFGLKAFSQSNDLVNKCNSNSIDELYSLIYSPLEPFEPPASVIDDDGNITASNDELFSLRRRHFYDQLKGQPTLSINLQTYATINKQLPGILEDFEPVIKILLPDCQPVSLFRGVPVSNTKADFYTILKTTEIGLKSEIESIVSYAKSYVEPKPIKFKDILGILKNDLAITPEIINAILPKPIAERYFPDGNIPTGNLSEAAILAFVSLGGTVIDPPNQIFFIKPRSYSGVIEDYSSLIIQEDGSIEQAAALNTSLVSQMLNRMGVKAQILIITEVETDVAGNCTIDDAGRWHQVIGGRKTRNCPFFSLAKQMLQNGTYKETKDYVEQNIVFRQLEAVLSISKNSNKETNS